MIFDDKNRIARSQSPSTTQDSVPMPSLSEVAFQRRLGSAGGPARGHELVRAELDTLHSRDDVRFTLSKEERAHYEAALQFLSNRYASHGLLFHASGQPFVFSKATGDSGICMTISRSPGVFYSATDSRQNWQSVGLWVHELTHATASVLWGAARSQREDSGWRFSISRAGCLIQSRSNRFPSLDGVQQGLLFEEYAACSNQSSYHRAVGAGSETVGEGSLRLSLSRGQDAYVCIFRLFSQICEPERFREIESSSNPRRWERALLHSPLVMDIPVPSLTWKYPGSAVSSSTYELLPLMDLLAKEIFPNLSPFQASEKLRMTAIEASVTGHLSKLFLPIREALGTAGLRFLLQWGTDLDNVINGEDTAMLALFVKASALGRDAARAARAELLDAVLQLRNSELSSSREGALAVETLVLAAEGGKWRQWLTPEAKALIAGHAELQTLAIAGIEASIARKEFSLAAVIADAAGLHDAPLLRVPHSELVVEARRILSSGLVNDYERMVSVFKPRRPLVAAAECRKLIHAAVVASLEAGKIGVFCEAAVSPFCDRESLITPKVKKLAQSFLAGEHSINLKVRLELALRGERYPD